MQSTTEVNRIDSNEFLQKSITLKYCNNLTLYFSLTKLLRSRRIGHILCYKFYNRKKIILLILTNEILRFDLKDKYAFTYERKLILHNRTIIFNRVVYLRGEGDVLNCAKLFLIFYFLSE